MGQFITRTVSLLLLVLCMSNQLFAQEEPSEETEDQEAIRPIYIPLKPPFVVNYGGVGKLQYLKAEVSVRVKSSDAANSVRHHMPFIRNNLVLLFSRQKNEDLETQEGKEMLRIAALEEVRAIIEAEDGEQGVMDLYFNNLIIQR